VRPAGVAAVAALLFVLAMAWRVLAFSGFTNDHYIHLARAQQVVLGAWPVRDFVDPGMPLMYLLSAAAWRLGGGTLGAEVLLVALAFAAGAACTFMAARRLGGSTWLAAGLTLLVILIWPRSYSYPKVLLYGAAAWAIVAAVERPSAGRRALLAVLTAVAFLFRHDHGLYIGAAAACAIALDAWPAGRNAAVQRLAAFAVTAFLLVSPWLAYVSYEQGLVDYFASGIGFSRAEAESTIIRALPRMHVEAGRELVTLRPPARPIAKIEWSPDTDDQTRHALEARYGLEPLPAEGPGEYHMPDASPTRIRALADDPHVRGSSGLGRVESFSALDRALAWLSPARIHVGDGLRLRDNSYVWLFYVFYALPIVAAGVVWRRRAAGRLNGHAATVIGALIVLALAANAGLIRGNLAVWLPDAIVPAVLLMAWLLPIAWALPAGPRRVAARFAVVVVVAGTVVATAEAGDFREQLDRTDVMLGPAGFRARLDALASVMRLRHEEPASGPSGVAQGLSPFFRYLQRCTSTRDHFFMSWSYPDVFVAAGRGFAGGHVALMEPFYTSTPEQTRTLGRLRHESVPFMLIFLDRERNFREHYPLLAAFLDERYEPMADVPVAETKGVRVYVEKGRASVRPDGETGWPCFV
jgi:hypothetical protein